MHIEFVRSGGFAGLRLTGSFDLQNLPSDQGSALSKLVEEAGFFNLPEQIKPTSPIPDQFEYRVVVTSDVTTHSIVVAESVLPDRLRPLVDYLTKLATSSKIR